MITFSVGNLIRVAFSFLFRTVASADVVDGPNRAVLPLGEAVASRAVFVIVPGSDGRTDGWKRFWSQLNNSKSVRDKPYKSMRS